MSMTPSQPYLVRAIYEWIVDNELTPYLLVDAEDVASHVPRQYFEYG
jgi:stringent starvation protein B